MKESGQGMREYCIIVAIIVLLAMGVVGLFGDNIKNFFELTCNPPDKQISVEKKQQILPLQKISNAERLQMMRDYGFYFYEPKGGKCFYGVLFYSAVSADEVQCSKRVIDLLINKNEYPQAEEGAR